MKSSRVLSVALVSLQLACIAGLLVGARVFGVRPWLVLELAGLGLVGWAVLTVRPQRVSPWPDVRPDAQLVTRGPYRWIRHPMYAGVLCLTLAWVLDNPHGWRLAVWLILVACLVAKLEYEEALLGRRFPEYARYRRRTKRLIPFVY